MAYILIVEDDPAIADLVAIYLRREGHTVKLSGNGVDALHAFQSADPKPDLILLDLMLPGLDGRGVARRVREHGPTPILMLTALDDVRDKIEGLNLGADDYLTKPFDPDELVARVRSILRRTTTRAIESRPATSTIRAGTLEIDLDARRVLVAGVELPLRTKEFELLATFAAARDVVLSREQLLERVWSGEFDGDTRTVDVHVSRLRERLSHVEAGVTIETVRSVGYRLNEQA
jgi:DNA-binding response OmpR family regulator